MNRATIFKNAAEVVEVDAVDISKIFILSFSNVSST